MRGFTPSVRPELLVIGHLAKDLTASGWRPGGAVTYAGLAAARLGVRTAVLTAADPSIDVPRLLPGVQTRCIPSSESTVMENVYTKAGRRQRVPSVATPITAADVPPEWTDLPATFVAPIIGEVSVGLPKRLGGLVTVGLQGWLRRRDREGFVHECDVERADLPAAGAAFVSDEDLRGSDTGRSLDRLRALYPLVVMTEAERGATIFKGAQARHIPAFPANVVDPTGAGDAFAAGFLVSRLLGGGLDQAARWGACVASFAVEGEGVAGLPTREAVEERLAAHPRVQLR